MNEGARVFKPGHPVVSRETQWWGSGVLTMAAAWLCNGPSIDDGWDADGD